MTNFLWGVGACASVYWIFKNPADTKIFEIAVLVLLWRVAMLLTYTTKKLDEIESIWLEEDDMNEIDMINHPPYEIEGETDV